MKKPNSQFPNKKMREYPVTDDPDKELETTPHYNDSRFNGSSLPENFTSSSAITVFGAEEEGLFMIDSDKMEKLEPKKAEQAWKIADQSGAKRKTQRWYENYLSAFLGEPVELKHIVVGINRSTAYPWQGFDYRFKAEGAKKAEGVTSTREKIDTTVATGQE